MALSPTTTQTSGLLNLSQASAQAIKLTLGKTFAITITKTDGNQVNFNLAGRNLTATTQQPLEAGKSVPVKVTQTTPNVVLQIQSPPPPPSSQANTQQILQNAYRQLLPQQMPINQGLQQLVFLSQTGLLPANLQAQLNALFDQLFKPSAQTSAKELKNQLLASGLFMENQLAKSQKPVQGDLKARLLQLLQITQQATTSQAAKTEAAELPKLSKLLTQTLSQITLKQIQAIENPNLMSIQLPLQPNPFIEEVAIDIRKQTQTQPTFWEVIVNLHLTEGEMSSKLLLMDEDISASLWADNAQLTSLLENRMPLLEEGFRQAGIPLKQLFITQQKPQSHPEAQKVALIDLHV